MYLGNLDAKRDWATPVTMSKACGGFSSRMNQTTTSWPPARTVSVRDFVSTAFKVAGIDIEWKGEGVDERGFERALIAASSRSIRVLPPTEVDLLLGDPAKAKEKLGWTATTTLEEIDYRDGSSPIFANMGIRCIKGTRTDR